MVIPTANAQNAAGLGGVILDFVTNVMTQWRRMMTRYETIADVLKNVRNNSGWHITYGKLRRLPSQNVIECPVTCGSGEVAYKFQSVAKERGYDMDAVLDLAECADHGSHYYSLRQRLLEAARL